MSRRRFIFSAALIILAAAALRLIELGTIPPGLHYDEATNGVIVRGIAFGGNRPLFIAAFTGKETLWFYLAALVMRLGGACVFSLRLSSAFIGILTVAATGWLVRRLYADDLRRDGLALLAMATLAVAFWHGVLSRLAFRAISQPLMQAFSLGLLWQGLRPPAGSRRRLIGLVLAGVATGLTGYTYLAARLFPIPLVVVLLVFVACDRDRPKRQAGLVLYGLGAVLAFAPLGLFFLRHPQTFGTRIEQVAPASLADALAGWRDALRMFFVAGDPLWRFNLPGRPIFGPALGVLFMIGLGVVVWDTIRAKGALDRARGALLLIWPLVMLAPTALAVGEITPSNLRAVGLAPLIALYPALGIVALARWLRRREGVAGRVERVAVSAALALIVLAGGGATLRDTLRWGRTPALYYDNDGPVAAMAGYLNGDEAPAGMVYTATFHFRHPTLAFLAEDYDAERSLFGGDALVLAPAGDTLAVYARDVPLPDEWHPAVTPYRVAAPPGPDTSPDFFAYLLPEGFEIGWPGVPGVSFANLIVLESATLHPAKSGTEATADLGWRILAPADQPDYAFVAEVCDAWGWCWVRINLDGTIERGQNNTYNSTQWTPGERLYTRLTIPLAQGMPPGDYVVRVSVYSAAGDRRLPVLDESGGFAGQYAMVEGLRIEASRSPQVGKLPMQQRPKQEIAPSITLLGYDVPAEAVRPGERINVALYWLSEVRQRDDYTVTLGLDEGTILYRGDPVHGTHPVSAWRAGELIADRYSLRLPHDLPPGEHTLSLRFDNGPPIGLGSLVVRATDRRFELPGGVVALETPPVFGRQIALAGYEAPVADVPVGGDLPLVLVWRAEAETETGYTVFVHLVDSEGEIIAQQDRPPQAEGEAYPTDLWLAGEVVVDDYVLPLPADAPPGEYTIRVGLYLPENGQRLSLPGTADNAFYLPLTITIR